MAKRVAFYVRVSTGPALRKAVKVPASLAAMRRLATLCRLEERVRELSGCCAAKPWRSLKVRNSGYLGMDKTGTGTSRPVPRLGRSLGEGVRVRRRQVSGLQR
jgi:hypothetical protein